jgi:hypothetical protein
MSKKPLRPACYVTIRSAAFGCLAILWLAAGTLQAQWGTVQGKVKTKSGETAKDLKIRVAQTGSPKDLTLVLANDKTGEYVIKGLRPGKYDFAACDGTNYVPEIHKAIEVKEGDEPTYLDFGLEPRSDKYTTQWEDNKNVLLCLRHKVTGCILAIRAEPDDGDPWKTVGTFKVETWDPIDAYETFTRRNSRTDRKHDYCSCIDARC